MVKDIITLNEGNGGKEMQNLLGKFLPNLFRGEGWDNFTNDSATFVLPSGETLCFTTDSFIVDPLEFPGGNIGHLAMCGTINDLAVMGAKPLGISVGLVIEEGMDVALLQRIMDSMNAIAKKYHVPIVTGDTKVMERGSLDKLIINTSGVGLCSTIINRSLMIGDKIIISGGIGEHGVALLSQRFDFNTSVVSDSQPVIDEVQAVADMVSFAKDPTRGGLAATLNEIAVENKFEIHIMEEFIPIKKEVLSATNLLGVDPFSLANEGRVIFVVPALHADAVVKKLSTFNPMACVIGEITAKHSSGRVVLKTELGSRIIPLPSGKIVPRIC